MKKMEHATIFLTHVFSFLIHPFTVGLGYDVLKGNPRGSGECNEHFQISLFNDNRQTNCSN